jgi:hypothetical protein
LSEAVIQNEPAKHHKHIFGFLNDERIVDVLEQSTGGDCISRPIPCLGEPAGHEINPREFNFLGNLGTFGRNEAPLPPHQYSHILNGLAFWRTLRSIMVPEAF